ncbi:MAG TPA: nuclear transport factor 2 family protein [Pyrinomonadaceae bacterium]|jgi:ketosteroid isomerase-like protein
MKSRVFIFLSLFIFSCSLAFAQAQSKDDAKLTALVKQMTDAQMSYQPAALDKIFASDYIEISPVGEFDPREKVLGFYKPEAKPDSSKMTASVEATDFSIRQYDKFAIVIARLNYTRTVEGKTLPPISMRATIVCRKEKGEWKIASAQYTGIRPPPASKS